jgi:hypothetical protein
VAIAPDNVDVPLLTIEAESPAHFAGCTADGTIVAMPTGPLLVLELQFTLVDGSTVGTHRAFDMASPENIAFWNGVHSAGAFAVSLENKNTEQKVRLDITLQREKLAALLEQSAQSSSRVPQVDGTRAVEDFRALLEASRQRHSDDASAWRAAIAAASGAAPAEAPRSRVSIFALPTGALVACWLETRAADGRLLLTERVFDLSSADDRTQLERAAADGAIALDVVDERTGTTKQYRVTVDGKTLTSYAEAGRQFLSKLPLTNAAQARTDFAALGAEARTRQPDVEKAWEELAKLVTARTNEFIERFNAARNRDTRRRKAYYYFARTIQVVSAVPLIGPYIVLFSLPAPFMLLVLWLWPGLRMAADANPEVAGLFVMAPLTAWSGWLDAAGILRINLPVPFIKIPFWGAGLLLSLGSLLALIFGS